MPNIQIYIILLLKHSAFCFIFVAN